MGFYAGDDGVYQLATRLAYHFAAANMSAGHPDNDLFQNLANLPFALQVGEKDLAFWRSRLAAKKFMLLCGGHNDLNDSHKYVTNCFLHMTNPYEDSKDKDESKGYEWRHNSWEAAEGSADFTSKSFVFLEKQLPKWEEQVKGCPVPENVDWNSLPAAAWTDTTWKAVAYYASTKVTQGKSVLQNINTNAINWVADHGPRDPAPTTVIWNLASRLLKPAPAPSPNGDNIWEQQRLFYWLYIRDINDSDY